MNTRTLLVLATIASLSAAVACSGDSGGQTSTADGGSHDASSADSSTSDGSARDAAVDSPTAADGGADSSPADSAADSAADGAETGAHVVTVGSGGLSFSPSTLTINVGETVRWVWAGSGHNVVSGTAAADNKFCSPNDTSCATAPTSASGTTYSHTFTTAGAYPYFCAPHRLAGMTGTITVQ